MTTSTESREDTRAEKIERFVCVEAITTFLQNLKAVLPERQKDLYIFDVADTEADGLSSSLWNELWPDWGQAVEPSQERAYAGIRSELLVAQMFAAFSAHPELARETADYFTALAEAHAGELQRRVQLRSEIDLGNA